MEDLSEQMAKQIGGDVDITQSQVRATIKIVLKGNVASTAEKIRDIYKKLVVSTS